MKLNEFIHLYPKLILLCYLASIKGNNSTNEVGLSESKNDNKRNKRELDESVDNYVIIQFKEKVTFDSNNQLFMEDYRNSISSIKKGSETISNINDFTVEANTKLEIHFNKKFDSLSNFFNAQETGNFQNMISVDFPNFDTSLVTTMSNMFTGCSSLENLDFSKFNTPSLQNMNTMFNGCIKLQNLDLLSFNTPLLISASRMFNGCTSLKYLAITNFDFSNIPQENIGNILYKDLKLEYIDISNIKDSNNNFKDYFQNFLKDKDNLTICQKENFITNENINNQCCRIINNAMDCNPIQTTIPEIETTIPEIETTIPKIETSIPKIEAIISQLQTSTIPIPKIETIISQIQTTIPQIRTAISNIQTSIPQIKTSIQEITNSGTTLILIGFNSFKLKSLITSFNVLFAPVTNNVYSDLMKVHLVINYK